MKTLSASIFITLFAFQFSIGQGCLPEGITFTTQEEIDSFQVNYPGCTEIEGGVIINSYSGITNLEGLSVINAIGGDLKILRNLELISLTGLENLYFIAGNLVVGELVNIWGDTHGNPVLCSLLGLSGFR